MKNLRNARFGFLVSVALLLTSCAGKPLPQVGKDHALNYYPIQPGKKMKYQFLEIDKNKPNDPQTVEFKDARYENGKYLATKVEKIYFGSKLFITEESAVEISERKVAEKLTFFKSEAYTEDCSKNPFQTKLILPAPGKTDSWTTVSSGTKYFYTVKYGSTRTSKAVYDDCIVLEMKWADKKDKGHSVWYYQRGVGLVRLDAIKPDGRLDKTASFELINP